MGKVRVFRQSDGSYIVHVDGVEVPDAKVEPTGAKPTQSRTRGTPVVRGLTLVTVVFADGTRVSDVVVEAWRAP